jgi:hypothetical protein
MFNPDVVTVLVEAVVAGVAVGGVVIGVLELDELPKVVGDRVGVEPLHDQPNMDNASVKISSL